MKHLIQIINNKTNYSALTENKLVGPAPKKVKKRLRFCRNRRYIVYKLNGFWFRLSRKQWAEYTETCYETICSRHKNGKTPGQILGYEKIIKTPYGQNKIN